MAIEYRVTFSDGTAEIVTVDSRKINTGFEEAVRHARRLAREPLGSETEREISSIEFWQRVDWR